MAKARHIEGQLSLFDELSPVSSVAPEELQLHYDAELSQLRQALPDNLFLGCSSWSFPGWEGFVYPAGPRWNEAKLAKKGLPHYARHPLLRSVSLDRGYYAPIPPTVLREYAAVVPADFRFVVKAPETLVTATLRGPEGVEVPNPSFLDEAQALEEWVNPCLQELGAKLGSCLLQFPPLKLQSVGGVRGFVTMLHRFCESIGPQVPLAVELRNPELFSALYRESIQRCERFHCVNIHPNAPLLTGQIEFAVEQPLCLIRWMLHPQLRGYSQAVGMFEPFNRLVKPDEESLLALAQLCARREQMKLPTIVIINNKAEGSSPLSLLRLARAIVSL